MKAIILAIIFTALLSAVPAQTVPVVLWLRPGLTSDSALAIVGSQSRRDTTWTGTVHRRVESITLRSVGLYGIGGDLYLGFEKHGRLTGALWNGGHPPPKGELDFVTPSTELTLQDAERVADSLSAELGAPAAKRVDGIDGNWWWELKDRSHSLSYGARGLQLSMSKPQPKTGR